MSGWIKVYRSLTEHWIYTEQRKYSKFEAWIDILLTVNFADNKTIINGKLIEIKRGESIFSLESWSKRWNWNKSAVKRFFSLLEKDGMIVLKNETVTTRLTVCKYEDYQGERNDVETQTKRARNADETRTKPIKEEKESKEEKETNIPTFTDFLNYALESKPNINKQELEIKYKSWVANDWSITRNNKKNPILNWKTTLLNTLKYISEQEVPNPYNLSPAMLASSEKYRLEMEEMKRKKGLL